MLPALYRGLTAAATPLVVVYLKSRRRRGKEDEQRFSERLGIPGRKRPQGPLVWIHAASIGEATSVLALIDRLLEERPGLQILLEVNVAGEEGKAGIAPAGVLIERQRPRAFSWGCDHTFSISFMRALAI